MVLNTSPTSLGATAGFFYFFLFYRFGGNECPHLIKLINYLTANDFVCPWCSASMVIISQQAEEWSIC